MMIRDLKALDNVLNWWDLSGYAEYIQRHYPEEVQAIIVISDRVFKHVNHADNPAYVAPTSDELDQLELALSAIKQTLVTRSANSGDLDAGWVLDAYTMIGL